MINENLKVQLFRDGIVKNGEREFTRLIGGFGENKPMFTLWQSAELLNDSTREISQNFNKNESQFEENVDYIDLKSAISGNDSDQYIEITRFLKEVGYSQNKLNATKQWLAFSFSGMMKLVKISKSQESWNIYNNFLEDYFKTKAENVVMRGTLEEEKEFIISEKKRIYGELSMEEDESTRFKLTMEIEKYNKQLSKIQSALDNKEIKTALENQAKLTESKKKMMTQADFGAKFNNKIGAKNIGKLFKIVGLAKKSLKNTVPYEKYCPKYAVTDINNKTGIASYLWNYRDCLKMIDYWLEDNGHYDEFYALTTKKDLQEFINIMYTKYVENPEKKIS